MSGLIDIDEVLAYAETGKLPARGREVCAECGKRSAVWSIGVWRGGIKSKLCRLCARSWKRWRADHHKSLVRR